MTVWGCRGVAVTWTWSWLMFDASSSSEVIPRPPQGIVSRPSSFCGIVPADWIQYLTRTGMPITRPSITNFGPILADLCYRICSLLDKGFDEVAPLVRDTVRKVTQSTGVKPKRPRESRHTRKFSESVAEKLLNPQFFSPGGRLLAVFPPQGKR